MDQYQIKQGTYGSWFVVFMDGLELEWFCERYPEYASCAVFNYGQYENAMLADDFYKVNH